VWVFGAMLVTLPFLENMWPSFEGTKASYRGSMGAAVLLYIYPGFLLAIAAGGDRGAVGRRLGSWLWRAAGFFVATIAVAHGVALAFSKFGDISFVLIIQRDYLALPLLIVAIVASRAPNPGHPAEGLWLRGFQAIRWLLLAIFLTSFFSSAASFHPIESLRDFREDIGSTIAVTLVLLDVLRNARLLRRLLTVLLAIACYIAVINFGGLYRFAYSTEIERLAWIEMGIVYSYDYLDAQDRHLLNEFDYRPVYPFLHHNRLSNFAMMAAGAGLVLALWPGVGARRRLQFVAGVAMTFALLQLTLGRGAWLAFFGGIAVAATVMFSPRRASHWALAAGLVVAAIGGFALLSPFQQERLTQTVDSVPQIVNVVLDPDAQQWPDDLNLRRRLIAMQTAVRAIRAHPWLGTGYGTHTYERLVPTYQQTKYEADPQESEQYQSHSHNNLLQIAAETGLPTLLLYCLLQLVACAICVAAVRTAHRRHLPLRWPVTFALALFVMTHAYGMTNYSLRYTMGHLTWTVQVLCVMLALRSVTETETVGGGETAVPEVVA
jgi:O-antigen ligase